MFYIILIVVLLPAIVLGCHFNRKYTDMLMLKVIRSVIALPFLIYAMPSMVMLTKRINALLLSGYFLHDETIVIGGAFDQNGLLKHGALIFFCFMSAVSVMGMHRMWLKSCPTFLTRILSFLSICMLVLEIGSLFIYHWYLFRYIAAMGFTFNRMAGLVCGAVLFVEIIFVLLYSLIRCVKPNASAGKVIRVCD